ncbi:MAG TPA: hypothetical protein DGG94_06400 [Micromonosporaceae bacterium]|nr:hypothetical protein [Micromonosporaceae bacterium]HCU49422.1 hypothetical protein [Micromonosporaceae bacterium]
MFERLERFAPLTGVLFLVLFAGVFFSPETPGSDDPAAEMVKYWADHSAQQRWIAAIASLAAVVLVWFGGSLRRAILRVEGGDGRLAALAFAGTVVIAIGILIFSGFAFTAAETVNKVPAEVTQTITVLSNEFFLPLAAGLLLLFLASALAILRHGVLPQWLGWVTLALVVLLLTPIGWLAFPGMALWAGLVGILLFIRGDTAQ